MSEYRVEKTRVPATLTLSTGTTVDGHFFLSGGAPTHAGPERVIDLLNADTGFLPFEPEARGKDQAPTALYNRAHIVTVLLPTRDVALERDPSCSVAKQQSVSIRLSNGELLAGTVHVVRPIGNDRLSDYTALHEAFRAIETPDRTLIVNSAYVVSLLET